MVLAAAAAVAEHQTRLPVVWVAFGAEEPRGPSDEDHHYGSRAYVAALARPSARRCGRWCRSTASGWGSGCRWGRPSSPTPSSGRCSRRPERAGVPTTPDPFQRSSDHWSFVREGLPGARLGSTPYAGYHSAADVPSVVDDAQLARVGRLLLAWLAPLE